MKIRRLFSLSVIVLATILVLTLGSGVASAADFCRTDPKIVLDNGMTLTIDVSIGPNVVENVKKIEHKIYLPKNVGHVGDPEYYGNPSLVAKESVTFAVSRNPGEYKIETQVLTKGRASVIVVSQLGKDPKWGPDPEDRSKGEWSWGSPPASVTVMGKNGQPLRTTLTVPTVP